MSDILERLRTWTHSIHAVPVSDMLDEAADEIDRLRLTDAEREAVEWAVGRSDVEAKGASGAADRGYKMPECRQWAENHDQRSATLRSLLERLSPPAT